MRTALTVSRCRGGSRAALTDRSSHEQRLAHRTVLGTATAGPFGIAAIHLSDRGHRRAASWQSRPEARVLGRRRQIPARSRPPQSESLRVRARLLRFAGRSPLRYRVVPALAEHCCRSGRVGPESTVRAARSLSSGSRRGNSSRYAPNTTGRGREPKPRRRTGRAVRVSAASRRWYTASPSNTTGSRLPAASAIKMVFRKRRS